MSLDLTQAVNADGLLAAPATAAAPPANVLDRRLVRAMDLVLASAAVLLLLPVMLVVVMITMVTDPGPVFFRQSRIGVRGKVFYCYKFRTMVTDADTRLAALLRNDPAAAKEWALDHKLKNDPRISGVGRFLRKSSIDELPQLLNVLAGDMGLVGPRPIVAAEIGRYGRYFVDYCRVKPGITGLWQISGRNNVSYRRRVALDVAYARNQSVKLDLRILLLTLPSVLLARGSY